MARTVITAPRKPSARPAPQNVPSHSPAPKRQADVVPAQPPSKPEETALSEAEAIEQRLSDGLVALEEKQAEHRARLAQISQDLAALPGRLAEAGERLTALQHEQALLPRRLNGARAVLVGALGTKNEATARAEVERLEARQQTLPPNLGQAEAALQESRAACEQERARLEQERAEHQAQLSDLAGMAEALRDEADKARRQIGEAQFARAQEARAKQVARIEAVEASLAEAKASLTDLDTEARAQLSSHPDLLLAYLQHVPVNDLKAQRLRLLLDYRRTLYPWLFEGNYTLGLSPRLFCVASTELDPSIMKITIDELEGQLSRHIAEQQQRLR